MCDEGPGSKEHHKDVYGVNSLGESLRFVLSGFGGRQVLVVVWHPSVLKASPLDACSRLRLPIAEVIDNFHLHRPPVKKPHCLSQGVHIICGTPGRVPWRSDLAVGPFEQPEPLWRS